MNAAVRAYALLCVAGLALAGGPAIAGDFVAHLAGKNEVPPVETNAQGQVRLSISDDGSKIDFRLNVAGIKNVTQAHIHCGPTGVNGPVVVFLFGLISGGVDINGILSQGTIEGSAVIPRPDSEACPGGVADLADVIAKIEAGQAYVNAHTVQNPGGEIRGQLQPAD